MPAAISLTAPSPTKADGSAPRCSSRSIRQPLKCSRSKASPRVCSSSHRKLLTVLPNEDIPAGSLDRWHRRATYTGCALLLGQWIAYNFVDIDLGHQLGWTPESRAAGHLLRIDPYAYTPTLPWIDHEWGAGAVAYFATHWFGARAILVLKYFCALGTLVACIRCSEKRGADFPVIGLCAPLAIFLCTLGFLATVRAQDYSFLFTAIWLLFLEYDRRGSRVWIAFALAIFALWVNLHAGFFVVLGLTALQAAENLLHREPYWHLLLLLCAMTLEILINPYGAAYFLYLKRALLMSRPYSPEWSGLGHLGAIWVAAYVAALLIALAGVWRTGWLNARGLPYLIATAIFAARHSKMLPLFAIAWLCYVPSYLQAARITQWWRSFAHRRQTFMISAWTLVICVCVFGACRNQIWRLDVPQQIYPVGAVDYLGKENFKGNLMVPFRLGAYVSWKLYPAVKVSMDSRYEVAYPDGIVKQIFDFYDARPTWRATLAAYPTDAVLIPRDSPIAGLVAETGWQHVYTDRQFEIYARPGLSLPTEDDSSISFQGSFP